LAGVEKIAIVYLVVNKKVRRINDPFDVELSCAPEYRVTFNEDQNCRDVADDDFRG